MAFPTDVVKVSIIWGTDPAEWPGEMAVNTFWMQHVHVDGASFDWTTAVGIAAVDVAARLVAHWSDLGMCHGPGYGPRLVKVAQTDSAGHTVNEGAAVPATLLNGTGTGSKVLPPEVAVAVSLYGYEPGAFAALKGRKRGRMYLPYISPDLLAATGRVDPGAVTTVVNAWGAFFNDIQGMTIGSETLHDHWNLVVVSSVATGMTSQVNWVACDDKFDSQRRRQHQSGSTVTKTAITV